MDERKLNRADMNVLERLSELAPGVYERSDFLPNGHGHTVPHGATGVTLKRLTGEGLIEYGKDPQRNCYGYRLTDAGRLRYIAAGGKPGVAVTVEAGQPS